MSKHALTRVTFNGDKTIIVAGAIPDAIAVRGLTEKIDVEPAKRPGATRIIPKPPVPPARVPVAAEHALTRNTQAEPIQAKENE